MAYVIRNATHCEVLSAQAIDNKGTISFDGVPHSGFNLIFATSSRWGSNEWSITPPLPTINLGAVTSDDRPRLATWINNDPQTISKIKSGSDSEFIAINLAVHG